MVGWNFADVYEAVAARVPDRPCQVQGARTVSWAQFDARADALAADLIDAGLTHQSKVVAYLFNCPEYLETYVAAFKGGFAPVNTNYRYGHDEIVYLFDNSDAEAVVFHAAFVDLVETVRHSLPKVRRWYCVADGTTAVPDWAVAYESVVATPVAGPVRGPWGRSGDDLLLLYTGGTTGMPKGVMWRQDDLFNVLGSGGNAVLGVPPATSIEELVERLDPATPGFVLLSACPLMHGTGQFSSLIAMNMGGCIVTLPSRHFDVEELLSEIERNRVNSLIIVGQAFAGPLLEHLDANPTGHDLSSVIMMSSSGVMWSQENKEGLLRHVPQAALFDSFGSSEAVGMGASVSTAGGASRTARFQLGPNCVVFADDGRRVQPGSGERGLVAVGGYIPVGYYKDEAKSAQTFRIFEDRRWSVPGDWAEVMDDGTLVLLGRGSVCINTGGEKVFPEEVEEALKQHPRVRDAVAVGIPDARFGETICAVVEAAGDEPPTLHELSDHVKEHLAHYKAPRHLVLVDTIGRAPNGKVDYRRLTSVAVARLGES
ncbi:MAG: acyl-CoA synthetase [Actinomycetota bacterium]|nr:acyl-CoA synthetase [Actinomycetota bacterium]